MATNVYGTTVGPATMPKAGASYTPVSNTSQSAPPTTGFNLADIKAEKTWTVDPKTQTVAGQLEGVIAKDSPIMQQARVRALQAQNRNGTLNSSMAISAGDSAVYDKALEIASPDAATYASAGKFNAEQGNAFTRDANAAIRDGAKQDFTVKANEWSAGQDFGRTTARDSTLNDYTVARDKALSDYAMAKDDNNNLFTLNRDAAQNLFTTGRDATLNDYTVARDGTLNDYTTTRDSTLNDNLVARDSAAVAATTARDATLNDNQVARDSTLNDYTTTRDSTLNTNQVARDTAAVAATTARDSTLNDYTTTRDSTLNTNQVARDDAAVTAQTARDTALATATTARDDAAVAAQTARDTAANTATTARDAASVTADGNKTAEARLYGARSDFTQAVNAIISNKDLGPTARKEAIISLQANYNNIIYHAAADLGWDSSSWVINGDFDTPDDNTVDDGSGDGSIDYRNIDVN